MLYPVVHAVLPPLFKAIWRPVVQGLEHIPADGAVILASNHLSFADSVVIPVVVPRKVVFMAKSDYFTGPGIKGRAIKAWFNGLDMIPVECVADRAEVPHRVNLFDMDMISADVLPLPAVLKHLRGLDRAVYARGPRATA